MLKLTVLICVVFCLEDILAAPERNKRELITEQSSNETVEIEETTKLFDEITSIETVTIQADAQGCINQNLQSELVNYMRDLSNLFIKVFDDVTTDIISSNNQFVDRLDSESVFFAATVNACASIEGLTIESCIGKALVEEKPKIAILIAEQYNINNANEKTRKLQWTLNTFELMTIHAKFLNAIQRDFKCQ